MNKQEYVNYYTYITLLINCKSITLLNNNKLLKELEAREKKLSMELKREELLRNVSGVMLNYST